MPEPKRAGRPPTSPDKARTARIPDVRCTPEQRAKWERIGGAKWQLAAIDRAKEPV